MGKNRILPPFPSIPVLVIFGQGIYQGLSNTVYLRILLLFCLLPTLGWAQSPFIWIDGQMDDWSHSAFQPHTDPTGDSQGNDLLQFKVANDDTYLYLQIKLDTEIKLADTEPNNNGLVLYIDNDNNAATGTAIHGLGIELEIDFANRIIKQHFGAAATFDMNEVGFVGLPTVTAATFEIALPRDNAPDGSNEWFPYSTIALVWEDTGSGDVMPDVGQPFTFIFDQVGLADFVPFDLERAPGSSFRLMSFNTLFNGLEDPTRQASFSRIIQAIDPDVITFNETWSASSGWVRDYLNDILPQGNNKTWYTIKMDGYNITASKFPFLDHWEVLDQGRMTASLIDLPDSLNDKNVLVVNGHLRCCGNDTERQRQADGFAKFVLDAKTLGGNINLEEGTPIILSGDMNLVGEAQILTTLLTGDIQDVNTFGWGDPLDWDNSDLEEGVHIHSQLPVAYTWRDPDGYWPPGKLDFMIYTNSVLTALKSFTLETDQLPTAMLDQHGLQWDDNDIASDHLPIVTDFAINQNTGIGPPPQAAINLSVAPNPAEDHLWIKLSSPSKGTGAITLLNAHGQLMMQQVVALHFAQVYLISLPVSSLPPGIYFVRLSMNGKVVVKKVVVM